MSTTDLSFYYKVELLRALLHAFPSKLELARLLKMHFSLNLDDIASDDELVDLASAVVKWADMHDLVEDVRKAARLMKPEDRFLNRGIALIGLRVNPAASVITPRSFMVSTFHLIRGIQRQERKRYDAALAHYDQAQAVCPGYAYLYNCRGWTYLQLSRFEQAIDSLSWSLILQRDLQYPLVNRGIAYRANKQYELALVDFRKALKLNPRLHVMHRQLGTTFMQMELHREAEQEYSLLLKHRPNDLVGLINRSYCYFKLGCPAEARTDLYRALQINPDEPMAHYNLACSYALSGDEDAALLHLAYSIRLEPSYRQDAPSTEELARLHDNPRFRELAGMG